MSDLIFRPMRTQGEQFYVPLRSSLQSYFKDFSVSYRIFEKFSKSLNIEYRIYNKSNKDYSLVWSISNSGVSYKDFSLVYSIEGVSNSGKINVQVQPVVQNVIFSILPVIYGNVIVQTGSV